MKALDKAHVFEYHEPHYEVNSKEHQNAPLQIIFDVKQEDLQRKGCLVAEGHVMNSSMYESYSSVVHTRTDCILVTIALNHQKDIFTGDIGNAFVQAFTNKKIYFCTGKEFGELENSDIVIKIALYGLSISTRQH